MVYGTSSINEVIGRIIMATGVQDTRLIAGFVEWIPQAMGLIKTKNALVKRWEDVEIEFHKSPLPCNVRTVLGAAYCGYRMHYYRGIRPADEACVTTAPVVGDTTYHTKFKTIASPEGNQVLTDDLISIDNIQYGDHTYYIEGNYINTSFASGIARVYYNSIPLDENKLPLIPDNENYKQAIYWYVRGMMIGAGYIDTVFKYLECDVKFWQHAVAARNEIGRASPDQMETILEFTRLVTPEGYFESFYGNPGIEQPYYI